MKKLFLFLIFSCALLSRAQTTTNLITVTITVTNGTANGFAFTLNGDTRTFTNSVTSSGSQILTNNTVAGTASNLYYQIASAGFAGPARLGLYTNGSNVITIRGACGEAMSVMIVSNWASVAYSTQSCGIGIIGVRVPLASEATAVATNVASLLAKGINDYCNYLFPTNSYPLSYYLSLGPQPQEASNKTFRASTIGESTITNSTLTNIVRINVSVLVGTNVVVLSGTISNAALQSIPSLYGILTALTNGTLFNTFITNSPSGLFTNLVATKGLAATNALLDQPAVTNLQGTLRNPFLGSQGGNAITFTNQDGVGVESRYDNSDLSGDVESIYTFGGVSYWSFVVSTNGIFFSSTRGAEANFISLVDGVATFADANSIVVLGGPVRAAVLTNSTFRGTNNWNGDLSFTPRANSALANGYNSAVVLGTNIYVRLSGPSGAYTNAGFAAERDGSFHILEFDNPGLSMTLLDNSGLDVTAANRLLTCTGALLNSTNNPVTVGVLYNATKAKWMVQWFR